METRMNPEIDLTVYVHFSIPVGLAWAQSAEESAEVIL